MVPSWVQGLTARKGQRPRLLLTPDLGQEPHCPPPSPPPALAPAAPKHPGSGSRGNSQKVQEREIADLPSVSACSQVLLRLPAFLASGHPPGLSVMLRIPWGPALDLSFLNWKVG